ncbi:MAG: gliding motility-associated C-terminal domain-containing protein [Flavobacteriales bacterium]|nr:gliding motility-associated C-terminal domain-containing protein [Flavobacteriales bacterium]
MHITNSLFGSLILSAVIAFSAQAQTVPISDGGSQDVSCAGTSVTFTDSDAGGTGYLPNEDFTITFCSDGGNSVNFFADVAGGSVWDIHESDTLFIYDGLNTSAPLIGAFNSATDPNGIIISSTLDNATGCLTLRFVSNAADETEGWSGTVECQTVWQPYSVSIQSIPNAEPTDTGFVDICQSDSVMFYAVGDYAYSGAGNGGYVQENSNMFFKWVMGDGTSFEGVGLDTIYYPFDQQAGYLIYLTARDIQGQEEYTVARVRVGTTPSFEGTAAVNDTICLGESTIINGVVTPTEGYFLSGGTFGTQLYLPDGNGVSYQTDITIAGYAPGQTIEGPDDLEQLCVNMEHSYLGDLEIELTCPNGQTIILKQYPGGTNTFLGSPIDFVNSNGQPGVGADYCFSNSAVWGTILQENTLGNHVTAGNPTGNSMTPGTYTPFESFNDLVGCPVNGEWTITITDNLGSDDGFIFSWGLDFSADIDGLAATPPYTPTIVEQNWVIDPTIVATIGDSAIEVQPAEPGNYSYTFRVTDDFGCTYDTTVTINVVPNLTSFNDLFNCGLSVPLLAADYDIIGGWTYISPGAGATATFSPNALSRNPTVTVNQQGTYTFIYTSDYCGQADTMEVLFAQAPETVPLGTDTVCPGTDVSFNALNTGINATYLWTPGAVTTQELILDSVTQTTGVQVVVTNDCGSATSAATVRVVNVNVTGQLEACLQDNAELYAAGSREGGAWSYTGPTGGNVTFSPDAQSETPTATASVAGNYAFTYTDTECGTTHDWSVTFAPAPTIVIASDTNRICVEGDLLLTYTINTDFHDAVNWSPYGVDKDSLLVYGTDSLAYSPLDSMFTVTISVANFCGEAEDSYTYQVINCNIILPNVFNPNSNVPDNSFFNVDALDLHPGNNMKIFDRWGRLCLDQDDYHLSPWTGDGAADGVYYYVLSRQGYDPITGFVHKVGGNAN